MIYMFYNEISNPRETILAVGYSKPDTRDEASKPLNFVKVIKFSPFKNNFRFEILLLARYSFGKLYPKDKNLNLR